MMSATKVPGPVLLVEDGESDVYFFRDAVVRAGAGFPLQAVKDGIDAVSYLSGTGAFSDRSRFPVPSLILLDLKLPRKSGLDVLDWLRDQESLRDIPVVILTSSSHAEDVRRAYALSATLYITKPMGRGPLRTLVGGLDAFWKDGGADLEHHLGAFSTPRPSDPTDGETPHLDEGRLS